MDERSTYPRCFDSYLQHAISSDFIYFDLSDEKKRRSRLFFLVEFKNSKIVTDFETAMNDAGFSIVLGPSDDNTPFLTMHADKEAVTRAVSGSEVFAIWEKYISRVVLSLPLVPSAMVPFQRKPLRRWRKGESTPGALLIGVLDDGCPFAAAHFLRSYTSTRVRGIWDQNQNKLPVKVDDSSGKTCLFGQKLLDFNYGLEFRRYSEVDAPWPLMRHIGLDEWLQLHATSTGRVDEDGCYANADFSRLSGRQSHGAHVMDVAAGRVPTSSRIGPVASGDYRDPPNWKSGTDPAARADVVFVQFAEDCIRDATGVWLRAYVLDGIRYILSFANPKTTKKVIINISYGPTTGPHDGTAELETALKALVMKYNGATRRPKLEIVIPAGNSYLSEGHVAYTRKRRPDHVEWTWRLLPDNAVLCFAEIWIDTTNPGPVSVTLTSPSGAVFTSLAGPTPPAAGAPLPAYTGVYAPQVRGHHTMWLLAVEPTRMVAEHGDWKIKVSGIPKKARIDAYVARSDPNMGVRTGAKPSYFLDHNWELTRSAEANCKYADGEFDRTGSLIRRDGTLNGIATGAHASVHVAGGYMMGDGRKSPYSSAGPARSGPLTHRPGPDYAMVCDASHALKGIRAGGNRSGSAFRLIGTSAAAPQLARHLADPPLPAPTDASTQPDEIAKRGQGNLAPP